MWVRASVPFPPVLHPCLHLTPSFHTVSPCSILHCALCRSSQTGRHMRMLRASSQFQNKTLSTDCSSFSLSLRVHRCISLTVLALLRKYRMHGLMSEADVYLLLHNNFMLAFSTPTCWFRDVLFSRREDLDEICVGHLSISITLALIISNRYISNNHYIDITSKQEADKQHDNPKQTQKPAVWLFISLFHCELVTLWSSCSELSCAKLSSASGTDTKNTQCM